MFYVFDKFKAVYQTDSVTLYYCEFIFVKSIKSINYKCFVTVKVDCLFILIFYAVKKYWISHF